MSDGPRAKDEEGGGAARRSRRTPGGGGLSRSGWFRRAKPVGPTATRQSGGDLEGSPPGEHARSASRRPRLALWTWLVVSHLLALALPAAAFIGTGAFALDLEMQTRRSLENQAVLIELLVGSELRHARERDPTAGIAAIADELAPALAEVGRTTFAGVRVISLEGEVVASNGPMLGVDLSAQPEVREALLGRPGTITRGRPPRDPRLGPPSGEPAEGRRVYMATPLHVAAPDGGDELVGALLLSRAPRGTWQVLTNMGPRLELGTLFAFSLTLGLAVLMGYGFSRSVRRLSRASHRLAESHGPPRARWSETDADLIGARGSRVAEVSALAEDFGRMADRLQARLHYIAEFAGNVSHEFKTPISTLRGTLELLEDDPDMPPEQRARFLDNALEELDRTQRLVDGLLALARADEARHREPVDLDDLARHIAESRPRTSVQGRAGVVRGDPAQLQAALLNLVDNALQHGGAGVSVQLHCWQLGDRRGVDVVDDGPGISPANLERVFDRFFTTDRVAGTGLGLALVKAIAEAHGGGIEVDSEPGRTRLRLWLPREPAD